jgi:peptide/nickel transport system substrate-binding protein
MSVDNLVDRYLKRHVSRAQFFKEAALLGISASSASAILAACSTGNSSGGGGSKTLTIAVPATPTTLDPEFISALGQDLECDVATYDRFVTFPTKVVDGVNQADVGTKPIALLAENWSVAPDNRTYTFNLRHGVKSYYGNELTAADVIWSWDRVFALQGQGLFPLGVSSVAKGSYTAVDNYTVRVQLTKANPLLPIVLATPVPGAAIYDSTEAKKHVTSDDPWAHNWLATNTASFGPYHAKDFTAGQQVTYVVNPNYYRNKPYFNKVVYKAIPDASARFTLLKSGQVDIAEELTTEQRKALASEKAVKILNVKGNFFACFALNNTVAPFDDVRVRQAIAYAMPIQDIIGTVYFNEPGVRLIKGYVSEIVPGYPDSWPYQPPDLNKAKQLLQAAGKTAFSFQISYSSSQAEAEKIAQLIRTALQPLGITAELNKLTPSKYQEQYYGHQAQSVIVQDAAFVLDPVYPLFLYFGQGKSAVANWINYKDPAVQDIIDQGLGEPDAAKRTALAKSADEGIVNDVPWPMHLGVGYHLATSSSLQGFVWRPHNLLHFADFSRG